MLRYILSISLLATSLGVVAQEEKAEKQAAPFDPGLAIGINAGTFIYKAFEPERTGVELTARFKYNRKWFAVGELGYENVAFNKVAYDYQSNGSFLRLGIDYNFFKVDEIGNNDNVIIGFRYGLGITEYSSDRFTIGGDYWGNYTGSIGSTTATSHWGEVLFGLRSEVLKHFYMGWSVRLRSLIANSSNEEFAPYTVPGYGRRDRGTNLSFTYTLEYHLPFRKKHQGS